MRIRRVRGQAYEDFERVYDQLSPRALSLARRFLRNVAEAEDVVSEAFARAFARWDMVRRLPYRDAWILRVATNLAIDSSRKRRQRPVWLPPLAGIEGEVVERASLEAELRSLPRRQREVIVLRYMLNVEEAHVAELLGVSRGAIKTHAHRGLAALRERLDIDFVE